ncbi:DUF1153 domain-containing protein [Nisaea denitrificans]|uniref:CtrA inhibitor SciP n=1 Tax=Nisaea denitrificans TaxID=390877 RepID=UPI00048D11E8|nr:DUF1153 domain-containing protein [Nisaea denitrificans]
MTADKHQDKKLNANSAEPVQTSDDPFAQLPPASTKRWVVSRKAQVVRAVEEDLITLEQACERYSLSHEEFASWRQLIKAHGTRALRATRVQDYRRASRRLRSGS